MKNKKFYLVPLLFVALAAMGAKIGENILRLGDKTGSDVSVQMGDGRLKWDDGTSKMQFSNDLGASFKDIGAGAGGAAGVNLIAGENEDFESGDPPTNWTESAGTFIAETTSPGFGDQSGSWDAAAGADTLTGPTATVIDGLEDRSCNATIQYHYVAGSSGDYKLQAVATGAGLLAEIDLAVTTKWTKAAVQFTCPSSDSVKVRITSTTNGGVILVDNATIGKSDFVDISQAELIAHAYYPVTTNCQWSTSAGGMADFPADTDCPSIIVKSSTKAVNTTDNDLPDIVFTDTLPPGIYEVSAEFAYDANTGSGAFRISSPELGNGVSRCSFSENAADFDIMRMTCTTTYTVTTATAAPTFKLQGWISANAVRIRNDVVESELNFIVKKYPTSSAEAITMETVGEHWDVSIGGANPALFLTAQATAQEVTDAGLDMVINTGSKTAEIPCLSGTASTGLTCSVNETVGIVIDITSTGRYRACFNFSHNVDIAAASAINTPFEIVETSNTNTTAIQRGKTRMQSGHASGSTDTQSVAWPIHICGDFVFTTAGQKTLRLMYEQSIAGTITTNVIRADRNASLNERDIHITVDKLDQQFPTPVFTDLTNSLDAKMESADPDGTPRKYVSVVVSYAAGVPSIYSTSAEGISGLTDAGVGTLGVTIDAGNLYTSAPSMKCGCTIGTAALNEAKCTIEHSTIGTGSWQIEMRNSNTGALFDPNGGRVQTWCIGK